MWKYVVRYILRYRVYHLIWIGLFTIFMAYEASQNKMSYQMAQMLPSSHPVMKTYNTFKQHFGQDGSVMFVGVQFPRFNDTTYFNAWQRLSREIGQMPGVEGVLSSTEIYDLVKDKEKKRFVMQPVAATAPQSQQAMDSVTQHIARLKFYENLLYVPETGVQLMLITLDKAVLNTKAREGLIYRLHDRLNTFGEAYQLPMHYSGLPYIRTITTSLVRNELYMFVLFSLLVAALILTFFFRNFASVFYPILIVIVATVWTLGSIALLGYQITILTGIIPPLLIVIGIENSIFLLNKYQYEYNIHGNKVKALSRMVSRIGGANFMTNATTAVGFAAFIFTGNSLLVEFGIVASINIFGIYVLTSILIPVFFSYAAPPRSKHLAKLRSGWVAKVVEKMVQVVSLHRSRVYAISLLIIVAGVVGTTFLKTSGRVVDDIPQKHVLYQDLMFFEKHLKGVMPLEIVIDSKKKRGITNWNVLHKVDKLSSEILPQYPVLSRPLSVLDLVKFSKQSFYNGNPKKYAMPSRREAQFIMPYMPKMKGDSTPQMLRSFIDKDLQKMRLSVQMANLNMEEIEALQGQLQPQIDSLFPPEKYDVSLTGTSIVFLKGSKYLVKNLFQSLLIALLAISILMALMFSSLRMVAISLIPNLIPQLLTAAMMGYLGIPIKPSTILIFSIALGISVDNTIHFLSRYRLHLRENQWRIKVSVIAALRETGYSMINSSIVLFFGFFIFTFSSFGGTEAMGYLISFTLLIALLSNLFLLPSILLSLNKWLTTKEFKEPVIEVLDNRTEEEKR